MTGSPDAHFMNAWSKYWVSLKVLPLWFWYFEKLFFKNIYTKLIKWYFSHTGCPKNFGTKNGDIWTVWILWPESRWPEEFWPESHWPEVFWPEGTFDQRFHWPEGLFDQRLPLTRGSIDQRFFDQRVPLTRGSIWPEGLFNQRVFLTRGSIWPIVSDGELVGDLKNKVVIS